MVGIVGQGIRDLIRQISTELDIEIISGKVAEDHVHVFVSFPPFISVSKMVQKNGSPSVGGSPLSL